MTDPKVINFLFKTKYSLRPKYSEHIQNSCYEERHGEDEREEDEGQVSLRRGERHGGQ